MEASEAIKRLMQQSDVLGIMASAFDLSYSFHDEVTYALRDASSTDQMGSKLWLLHEVLPYLRKLMENKRYPFNAYTRIDILHYGSWLGIGAAMLHQTMLELGWSDAEFGTLNPVLIDRDLSCVHFSQKLLKRVFDITAKCIKQDFCEDHVLPIWAPENGLLIAVNTVTEHISQDQFYEWCSKLMENALKCRYRRMLVVLQHSNAEYPDHVNPNLELPYWIERASTQSRLVLSDGKHQRRTIVGLFDIC